MGFRGVPGQSSSAARGQPGQWSAGRGDINCVVAAATCAAVRPRTAAGRTVVGIVGRRRSPSICACRETAMPPHRVTDAQAVFVEPLAAAVHVLDDLPRDRSTRVAVVGAGRLGLLVAQVLAWRRYRLDVIVRSARRRAVCERLGLAAQRLEDVKTLGQHDIVVECSGAPEGLRLALRLVRPRGTVVLKSTYAEPERVNLAPVVIDEMRHRSRCAFLPAIRPSSGGDRCRAADHGRVSCPADRRRRRGARPTIKVLRGRGRDGVLDCRRRRYARFEPPGGAVGLRHAFQRAGGRSARR